MYPFVLTKLKLLHKKLDRIIYPEKYTESEVEALPFHSLSPIRDADVAQYTKALKWALDNRKKESIYNIALSGPYGSGKSSILQTFKEGNDNPDYKFLEISLATFKEEFEAEDIKELREEGGSDNGQAKKIKKNEDILRLIELSILQQIFYHEEDETLPDSRFKKIRNFKKKNLRLITVGTMLAIGFGINLFFPKKIEEVIQITYAPLPGIILHWVSLLIFIASMSVVIYRSIRLVYGIRVSKLKFKEAEIEIDKNISKSILNNHLDEILYFFEVTKHSVVFIEDLDRFKQSEIFTKLRELNLLINKSKKVEQEVVFIYAVRDEMFKDKDRTKFFDFIIPVIPVINSSNSNDKLIKLVNDNKYQISNDLIDDVSFFIDDMRLLYNITNEYHIYNLLLDDALNQDKLLAMVVYKNIYPDDFVLLNDGDGKLYNLIKRRSEYISAAINEIDIEIKALKEQVTAIQEVQIKNGDELRLLYVVKFFSSVEGLRHFNFNGNLVPLEGAATESMFEYFKAGNFNYQYVYQQHGNYYPTNANADFKFSELQSEVDAKESYESRLEKIENHSFEAEEVLKKEIQRLEKKKTSIRHAKLKELLADVKPKITIDKKTKQGQLLSILLTSGYIDEDYLDYISLFYEGSISKGDRAFLLNVKSQTASEFDFKLTKVDNLIEKIRQSDFQFSYILNYDLLDFLIISDKYPSQKASLFNQLTDQIEKAPSFIDGFVTNGTNLEAFIQQLADKWPGFWKYVSERSLYPAEKIQSYYKLILLNSDTSSLGKQAEDSNLVETIEKDENFLDLSTDRELLKNVIGFFNIKFKFIPLDKGNKEMSDIIYKGQYYDLNTKMIIEVMKYAGTFNQPDFDQKNYHAIRNGEVPELETYVNENINYYLTEVYLKLPNNKFEPEFDFITLLDNKEIKKENVEKLIAGIETVLPDLGEMSNELVDDLLFKYRNITATWNNLAYYHYRHEESLSEAVIGFMNDIENATLLGGEELDSDVLFSDYETLKKFIIQISHLEELTDESFELISKTYPDDFMVEELKEISKEKMAILIKGKHIEPDAANFIQLKENFKPLHQNFLEEAVDDILENQVDYELDVADIQYIMRSNVYTKQQKLQIINASEKDTLLAANSLLRDIGVYIVANFPFPVDKAILIGALKQNIAINDRVRLFNMHYKQFKADDIPIIFQTFPNEFKDIGKITYSPVIDETTENRYLAKNLLERKFIANIKDEKRGVRLINFKKLK